MTPSILHAIYAHLDHNNPIHVVFWCVCLFAFLLLFRKSNLLPNTVYAFDPEKQLKHSNCVIEQKKKRIVVGIRWAKNHQFSRELLTFPLPELNGSILCPLRALRNLRKLVPNEEDSHLFALPTGGSLTYRRFQNML